MAIDYLIGMAIAAVIVATCIGAIVLLLGDGSSW